MERITPDELRIMLERRWRKIAPKKLLRALDGSAENAEAPVGRRNIKRKSNNKKI
jgi:hypothetical protein